MSKEIYPSLGTKQKRELGRRSRQEASRCLWAASLLEARRALAALLVWNWGLMTWQYYWFLTRNYSVHSVALANGVFLVKSFGMDWPMPMSFSYWALRNIFVVLIQFLMECAHIIAMVCYKAPTLCRELCAAEKVIHFSIDRCGCGQPQPWAKYLRELITVPSEKCKPCGFLLKNKLLVIKSRK